MVGVGVVVGVALRVGVGQAAAAAPPPRPAGWPTCRAWHAGWPSCLPRGWCCLAACAGARGSPTWRGCGRGCWTFGAGRPIRRPRRVRFESGVLASPCVLGFLCVCVCVSGQVGGGGRACGPLSPVRKKEACECQRVVAMVSSTVLGKGRAWGAAGVDKVGWGRAWNCRRHVWWGERPVFDCALGRCGESVSLRTDKVCFFSTPLSFLLLSGCAGCCFFCLVRCCDTTFLLR